MTSGLFASRPRCRGAGQPGGGHAQEWAVPVGHTTERAATSEAVAVGLSAGLDMDTMLEVLNGSERAEHGDVDTFVTHVLPGRCARDSPTPR